MKVFSVTSFSMKESNSAKDQGRSGPGGVGQTPLAGTLRPGIFLSHVLLKMKGGNLMITSLITTFYAKI